jgi:uncharacterized protein (DUF2062 family)
MLFKRREKPGLFERVRVLLWPRRNWNRSTRYVLHRIFRLDATPHAIALGCAIGVFTSFTPFMGGHFILAGLLAWFMRSSVIASALGTFFGNPLTFPVIWVSSYKLGGMLLGTSTSAAKLGEITEEARLSMEVFAPVLENFSWKALVAVAHGIYQQLYDIFVIFMPVIKPMLAGGIPLGILFGAISYFLAKKAMDTYRRSHPQ